MTDYILWGVELSPFVLKLQATLNYAGKTFRRLPMQGSYLENAKLIKDLETAKRLKQVTRYPEFDPQFDEYPSVPYLTEDGAHFQYDTSAIARLLDSQASAEQPTLFPADPACNFVAHLIDEAFDEFGLYLVHHMRWVVSAKTTPMGKLLAQEYRNALPPGGAWFLSHAFPKRQVRRCPYLFSMAPKTYKSGVKKALSPPSLEGFPETHSLLNTSWQQYLEGMESVLTKQPYLLGSCFTIADASAYGQLAMNLVDPEAAQLLQERAPLIFDWLHRIYRNEHVLTTTSVTPTGTSLGNALKTSLKKLLKEKLKPNDYYLNAELKPLLNTIMATFSALMIQNEHAYLKAVDRGETIFNEKAFNLGKALYDGQLMGYPFRSVVKTFQVRVWREIGAHWRQLSSEQQQQVRSVIDLCELFETQ